MFEHFVFLDKLNIGLQVASMQYLNIQLPVRIVKGMEAGVFKVKNVQTRQWYINRKIQIICVCTHTDYYHNII